MRAVAGIIVVSAFVALLSGCPPKPPPTQSYYGPTDPIDVVIRSINDNNQRIPTVWASGTFEARIIDEQKRSNFVNGTVTLVHEKPGGLRVVGTKDLVGTVFEVGSNDEQYWLIAGGDVDTMWWGSYAAATLEAARTIPIRPELVVEVLGIGHIDTNLRREPFPVLRFNNDADAYMIVWHLGLPDRLIAQKEVWYDRQTKHPKMVLLFDEHGRIILRAYLDRFVPLEIDGVPESERPTMASRYDLFFPESGSTLRFDFEQVKLSNDGAPNERSFRFPKAQLQRSRRVVALDERRGG
jgi:hypothetical protein